MGALAVLPALLLPAFFQGVDFHTNFTRTDDETPDDSYFGWQGEP
jgi:hypothetical protein